MSRGRPDENGKFSEKKAAVLFKDDKKDLSDRKVFYLLFDYFAKISAKRFSNTGVH